jgi:hypothetical protein
VIHADLTHLWWPWPPGLLMGHPRFASGSQASVSWDEQLKPAMMGHCRGVATI